MADCDLEGIYANYKGPWNLRIMMGNSTLQGCKVMLYSVSHNVNQYIIKPKNKC